MLLIMFWKLICSKGLPSRLMSESFQSCFFMHGLDLPVKRTVSCEISHRSEYYCHFILKEFTLSESLTHRGLQKEFSVPPSILPRWPQRGSNPRPTDCSRALYHCAKTPSAVSNV